MKIWVCSSGSYSDCYNTCAYTDEATAKAVSAAYGWNDPEELEVDPPVPAEIPQGLTYYAVRMKRNGDTDGYQSVHPTSYPGEDHHYEARPEWGSFGYESFAFYCWARDKEHAVKIANERRIMWLANEQRN
jgi:hypothetical protein